MNIVRRLLSSSSAGSSTDIPNVEGGGETVDHMADHLTRHQETTIKTPEQELLGLSHLKKLHLDYVTSDKISPQEKETKLFAMLPLFCNIFSNQGPKVITEKFSEDIIPFTQAASRLLVTEVRRRASNQSTEAAAEAIATFMEVDSNGWQLLSTLSLLVREGDAVAEVMTSSALPSTLVKCLYLFFDLPKIESSNVEDSEDQDENVMYTPKEKRTLLQKIFIQVLMRLCTHQPAVEELARKDDLTLLFSAITSDCPGHNLMWRKTSADILLTISRHSLSQPVISYLHAKGCINLCIENMQKSLESSEIKPLEVVEMFVTVFCFLKDSAQNSETLLEDFRTCQGYIFLSEFLLTMNIEDDEETREAMRNLVLLVASLTFCGHTDLKLSATATSTSLYQLDSFEPPEPQHKGSTVRNILAFQVLQSVFLKSNSEYLNGNILDAVSTIFTADNANYFLLESLNFLPQCAEKIGFKATSVQNKFFSLIEFLVHQLRFVPCKELIAISLILKTKSNRECSMNAVKSLMAIVKFDVIFKNVFREVGMLEALIECLKKYTEVMKSSSDVKDEIDMKLGEAVINALNDLIFGNSQNAIVYRDSGGVATTLTLAKIKSSRSQAVQLLQQLVLASGSEEDMTVLLELLQSTQELDARLTYIQAVITTLRESHRCRTTFRKSGGFVYILSILLSLDQTLDNDPKNIDKGDEHLYMVLTLIREIFNCLTTAMRYEPANAKYFHVEIANGVMLLEAIQLLGCFSTTTDHDNHIQNINDNIYEKNNSTIVITNEKTSQNSDIEAFETIFASNLKDIFALKKQLTHSHPDLDHKLINACLVLRMIYDSAIDRYEQQHRDNAGDQVILPRSPRSTGSTSTNEDNSNDTTTNTDEKKKMAPLLNLFPPPPEPTIVHPGVVTTILQLIPMMNSLELNQRYSVALQTFSAQLLQSLLRTEKNQQTMCDVGLLTQILLHCKAPLENENHPLHRPFQYLLERLAAQRLAASDLRTFLRLGDPLTCLNSDERTNGVTHGGFLPLNRVKTIVSMTTPRDFHFQNNTILPPFIEMDMASEGFGCIYIPSMAPTSSHTASVVGVSSLASQESSVIGGIGLGDRAFPSQPGLSFSTWICIDKFSDPRTDPHPVRLLTIARTAKENSNVSGINPGDRNLIEENYVCFALALSARDKALIISTNEVPLSKSCDWQPDFTTDHGARIWFPDLIKEGEWHHVIVVLNRQVLKNSSFSLYVNGQHIATQKIHFISPTPGGGAGFSGGNLTLASSVYAYIGTPPHWRRHSKLCWKQGPCLLLEDVATPQLANLLFRLGPHYLGSLQAPQITSTGDVLGSQISEDKIIFNLNSVAVSEMTLAMIKKIYAKIDNKSIAKQLSMATGENATPIRILHNAAGHLLGPARSLGGVIIGYRGVRVFNPQPVSKVIETVGGCHVLLGLIAMAHDMERLYAAVKALVCVIKSNPFTRMQMSEIKGYQILGMLLKKKIHLLNAHILHLMFTMAGTIDSTRDSNGIQNVPAFRDVLCDLDLWHAAPAELEKLLLEHFLELISVDHPQKNMTNVRLMREFALVEKLLAILKKSEFKSNKNANITTKSLLLDVIRGLLCANPRVSDVLCFALFTTATLTFENDEKSIIAVVTDVDSIILDDDNNDIDLRAKIVLRNQCLKLFFSLLYTGESIHTNYCEDVVQVVGFDWILLFLHGNLHQTTVVWGMRILMTLLSLPSLIQKFRIGNCNGHWLIKSENVLHNKMMEALGSDASSKSTKASLRNIRNEIFQVPGFQHLNWLMVSHTEIPQVYFCLMTIVLGHPVKNLPINDDVKLDLDSIWQYVFGSKASDTSSSELAGKVNLSSEAMVTILLMVRTMLNYKSESVDSSKKPPVIAEWMKEYPITITQFLFYLYHNLADFMPAFMTPDVLTAVAATLFPIMTDENISSMTSPNKSTDTPFSTALKETSGTTENSLENECLTNHPARKNVINFMRVLIVDSLSMMSSQKNPPVIDLLLDAQPDHTTALQRAKFQTELLWVVMDHLIAADILIGDQAALPVVPGGNYQYIAPNVFYLSSRLIDKLWQGVLQKPSEDVFQFVLKLISQAKRRSGGGGALSLEGIYKSLNRSILYMLSRPHSNVAGQMSVLEVLHRIVDNRSVIFGLGNHELDFFGCLTFCLLRLFSGKNIPMEAEGKTTWHVNPNVDDDDHSELAPGESAHIHEGQNLLVNAAARVWDLLYVSKKPALEEVFKISFGNQNLQTPSLATIMTMNNLYEQASKIWFTYMESEKKGTYAKIPAWEFHSQLQSRLQKVTGGFAGRLGRLASMGSSSSTSSNPAMSGSSSMISNDVKNKSKEDLVNAKVEYSTLPCDVVDQSTTLHVSIVKDVIDQHYRQRIQTDDHMSVYIEEEWSNIGKMDFWSDRMSDVLISIGSESMLVQERGIWGPYNESRLTKWNLDMTEGPCRMRKKFVRNPMFYLQYPYQKRRHSSSAVHGGGDSESNFASAVHKGHKYKKPSSHDSKLWHEQNNQKNVSSIFGNDIVGICNAETLRIVEEYDDCDLSVTRDEEVCTSIDEEMRKIGVQALKANRHDGEDNISEEDILAEEPHPDSENSSRTGSDQMTQGPQSPSSLNNSEPMEEEQGSSDYQTVMRLLEHGEKITHMYRCARIQGLDTTEGLVLFGRDHFYILDGFTLVNSREVHDINFISTSYYEPIIPQVPGQTRPCSQRQVFKHEYEKVKEIHKRRYLLQPIALEVFCFDGQNQLLAFMKDTRTKVYQRFLTVSKSIADSAHSSVAGQRRSANVEQSGGLFSSLMGETSVTQRWIRGEISNFQYLMALNTLAGRTYSDLMQYPIFPWILAEYKSNEEPDLTDPATFRDLTKPMGAQTDQRLVQFKKRFKDWDDPHGDTPPYHYGTHYSSAMIVSSYLVRLEPFTQHFLHLQGGHFDLADRMFHSIEEAWNSASKNNMADVRELIPEFFYLPDFLENQNRFDMGYKQNGEPLDDVLLPPWAKGSAAEFIRIHRAALESDFVSQHLHEWIDLIFGYKQQGPAAVESVNVFHHLFYEGNVDIFSIEDPLQRNATIGFINNFGQIPKQLFKKAHPAKRVTTIVQAIQDDNAGGTTSTGDLGITLKSSKLFFHHLTNLRPTMTPIKELKGPVGQLKSGLDGRVLAVEQNKVLVPGSSNRYLAWGFPDQSFRLGNYESDKAVFICEPSYLIGQVLTCVCPNSKLVISGSSDSVVRIWAFCKKAKQLLITKLLYGHTDAVTCLATSSSWSVAVSGSRDRSAIIWDLSRDKYVKHLPGHVGAVAAVAINDLTGDIVTCAGSCLYVWDIAGRPLSSIDTNRICPPLSPQPKQQQILCLAFSQMNEWDRENVIMSGSSDGVVRMWSMDLVEVSINVASDDHHHRNRGSWEDGTSQKDSISMRKISLSNQLTTKLKTEHHKDITKTEESSPNTSSDHGFVLVNNPVNEHTQLPTDELLMNANNSRQRIDSDGYVWKRQLVFRAKLTMHTAFERPDNAEPAGVTALAISDDNEKVFVGDERGRVFSWSVASKPGKGFVDHWMKDECFGACLDCGINFTIYERRHHCRNCGKVFCSSCSQYQAEIPRLKILQPVRVCKPCHDSLLTEETSPKTKKP